MQYEKPEIRTVCARQLLEAFGPASALGSGPATDEKLPVLQGNLGPA